MRAPSCLLFQRCYYDICHLIHTSSRLCVRPAINYRSHVQDHQQQEFRHLATCYQTTMMLLLRQIRPPIPLMACSWNSLHILLRPHSQQHATLHTPAALVTPSGSGITKVQVKSATEILAECASSLPPEAYNTGDATHPAPAIKSLDIRSALASSSSAVCTPGCLPSSHC